MCELVKFTYQSIKLKKLSDSKSLFEKPYCRCRLHPPLSTNGPVLLVWTISINSLSYPSMWQNGCKRFGAHSVSRGKILCVQSASKFQFIALQLYRGVKSTQWCIFLEQEMREKRRTSIPLATHPGLLRNKSETFSRSSCL